MIKFLCVLALPVVLAGCEPMTMASLALSGISIATTGKSISDHAISAIAQEDCAMWRIIRGSPMCREPQPAAGAPPAMTLVAASRTPAAAHWPGAPQEAALSGIAPAAGVAGAPLRADELGAGPGYLEEGPYELVFTDQSVVANANGLRSSSARLVGCPPSAELFALVQDDGALEVFVYDPTGVDGHNLQMVLRIVDYARNPDAFAGLWMNGSFYFVGNIIA